MSKTSFWAAPYRPMFTGAALWALLCIGWWPLGTFLGLPAPSFSPSVLWHVHELIFGFAGLAVGGYLLTALPNWVGKPPESGAILQALLATWLLARFATAIADHLPLGALLLVNAAYFLLLGSLLLTRILSARNYTKLPFPFALFALGAAETLYMTQAKAGDVAACLALAQTMLVGFAILISAIGLRAIPAFTSIWHQHLGQPALRLAANAALRIITLALLSVALVARQLNATDLTNALLLAAALTLLTAMTRWRSLTTWRNPLLAGLHAAFLWLPLGLLFLAAINFTQIAYPTGDALHTLTIGAVSSLILAFTGRAASHTPEGLLRAPKPLTLAIVLIWLATAARLTAPLTTNPDPITSLAATLWCVAWLAYLIALRPALKGTPVRPVLSGRTPKP